MKVFIKLSSFCRAQGTMAHGATYEMGESSRTAHDTSEGNIQQIRQISKAQVSKIIGFFVLFGNKGNGVQGGRAAVS